MMKNLDFEDNVFFNEKLKKALPYQIKSYDAIFSLTRKEFDEIKRVYVYMCRVMDAYGVGVAPNNLIKVLSRDLMYLEFMRDVLTDFTVPSETPDLSTSVIFYDFEKFIIQTDSKKRTSRYRWYYPFMHQNMLSSTAIAKLKVLSELEFKSLVLDLLENVVTSLKNVEINLNEKQTQFLLYFLELEVFYGSEEKASWNSFKLRSSEKSKDLTHKKHSFTYSYITHTAEDFQSKYNILRLEWRNDYLYELLKIIPDKFRDFFGNRWNDIMNPFLWNHCKKEYPELYKIYQMSETTSLIVGYYDDMEDDLLDMFKMINQMGKNFPEMDQIEQDLNNFKCEHFTKSSTYSLSHINQKFISEKIEEFNNFTPKSNSKFELYTLFILYKSYNKFINDPQYSKAQRTYLEKYFESLGNDLLEINTPIIKQELEQMLNFYMNEIKKFTLNSNSITGIKLEDHFEILKENLLALDTRDQLQLYFVGIKIKNNDLLNLTEWFSLLEKMINKYNINDKKEYKKYILKPQKRGIK